MKTVLISGANRGLGLEFCRQYAQAQWRVLACCRQPKQAEELQQLATRYQNLQIYPLDISDFSQIEALSVQLCDESIDILINNAGVFGDKAEQGFGALDYQAWSQTLTINVQAPMKMAEAFFNQVQRSETKLIVAISSLMGSIADNGSGGTILYRSSKAALNAGMKSLAMELKSQSVGVLIFHPGWVRTDMGGVNGLIDPPESISGMRAEIENFCLEKTGSFIKYDGSAMPW